MLEGEEAETDMDDGDEAGAEGFAEERKPLEEEGLVEVGGSAGGAGTERCGGRMGEWEDDRLGRDEGDGRGVTAHASKPDGLLGPTSLRPRREPKLTDNSIMT